MAKLTRNEAIFAGVGVAIGIGIGFTAGYFFAKKTLREYLSQLAEDEVAEMREYLLTRQREIVRQGKPDLESLIATERYTPEERAAINEVEDEVAAEESELSDLVPPMTDPRTGDVWDFSVEIPQRTKDRPYIIHIDEVMEDKDEEWNQPTFTYYEGDDVLADEAEEVIDDREAVVGEDNLMKFGHGSGDPNVVYIRNERLTMDIEVLRNTGKYAVLVHGFIEHGDEPMRRNRRRISDDD